MCDPVTAIVGGALGLVGMSMMQPDTPSMPQMPTPTAPPAPPQEQKAPDPANMGQQYEDQQKNSGPISTWLTGASGALVSEKNKSKNVLLGG